MEIEKPVRVSRGFANLRIERHCITSDTILITSPHAVKPYAKKKDPGNKPSNPGNKTSNHSCPFVYCRVFVATIFFPLLSAQALT